MSDEKFKGLVEKTRRAADTKDAAPETGPVAEEAEGKEAFSVLSADRMQKVMCEFRFKTGDSAALPYSYLVLATHNRSDGIELDFSAHKVRLVGQNLGPLYLGLVAQRVASVQEVDELQGEAELGRDATVVTKIELSKAE